MDPQETWKDIPLDILQNYQVSNHGNIRHLDPLTKEPTYKSILTNADYKYVSLTTSTGSENFRVHRLVALTYIPLPEEGVFEKSIIIPKDGVPYQVNHKDGVKSNNFYKNLEWCDQSYNTKHGYETTEYNNGHYNVTNIITGEERKVTSINKIATLLKTTAVEVVQAIRTSTYNIHNRYSVIKIDKVESSRHQDISIKDYVNNTITVITGVIKVTQFTGVKIDSVIDRLSKRIPVYEETMVSGYVIRSTKDTRPFPKFTQEEALISREAYTLRAEHKGLAKSLVVDVKDYVTGTIVRYSSIKDAAIHYGYNEKLIRKYTLLKDKSKLPMFDGKVFKTVLITTDFPTYTKEEVSESLKLHRLRLQGVKTQGGKLYYITGRNYSTGDIKEFESSRLAADFIDVRKVAIDNLLKAGRKPKLRVGWYFQKGKEEDVDNWPEFSKSDIQLSLEPSEISLHREHGSQQVTNVLECKDLRTGVITEHLTTTKLAKHLDVASHVVNNNLKEGRKSKVIKGCWIRKKSTSTWPVVSDEDIESSLKPQVSEGKGFKSSVEIKNISTGEILKFVSARKVAEFLNILPTTLGYQLKTQRVRLPVVNDYVVKLDDLSIKWEDYKV